MTLPFTPKATVNLSATSSTGRVQMYSEIGGRAAVIVTNPAGNPTVFINFGGSTVEATTSAGLPILAGTAQTFTLGASQTHVAGITASGSGTIYFTPGEGI